MRASQKHARSRRAAARVVAQLMWLESLGSIFDGDVPEGVPKIAVLRLSVIHWNIGYND